MNTNKLSTLLVLTTLSIFASCERPIEDDLVGSAQSQNSILVNATLGSLSENLEDQADSELVAKDNLLSNLLISKAYASEQCQGRAINETCDNGIQEKAYVSCSLGQSKHLLSGNVSLTYSNGECSLAEYGETVRRQINLQRVTPWGATITRSSTDHEDYNGEVIGGGSLITKLEAGNEYEILGMHRYRTTAKNRPAYDISIRSQGPLNISGGLKRHERRVESGTLIVSHNLAKFTSTIDVVDLEYSNDCCHPVAGSLQVTFAGSRIGTASISFNGCGEAQLEKDGTQEKIALEMCQ